MTSKKAELSTDIKELEKAFNGDTDLLLFFMTWVKNGLNASKAYLELHPNVKYASARVMGPKQLAKINKTVLMAAYELDIEKYMTQLKDGLGAMKVNEFSGELYADHAARKPYHDKLGKLLGLEQDKNMQVNIQNNIYSLKDLHDYLNQKEAEEGELI